MKKIAFLLIAIILIPICAQASDKKNISLPAILKADKIDGDRNSEILNANGNVELNKDGNTLFTDSLIYDKKLENIYAVGNVRLENYSIGNVLAKDADMKSDLKSGNLNDATIVFHDGSYIKSPKVSRIDEYKTIFKTPIFSICPNDEIKENNSLSGEKEDLISITSSQTTIDKSTNSIKSNDGVFRIYNFPFFYTPYLSLPLPSSKRKSGLLPPSYLQSTKLGMGIKIPYYFNIAPDKDLTTSIQTHPIENHLILHNDYRQLLKNGEYKINLQIANNEPKTNNLVGSKVSEKQARWYGKSDGKVVLPKDFEVNFNINHVGDKNYFRDYTNSFQGLTLSEVDLDYIKNRDYFSIRTVKIQELEINKNSKEEPTALPVINYYTEHKPKKSLFNQTYSLLANSTVISRAEGEQYRRASLKPEITIPYNLAGNLFEFSGNMQGDIYNLDNRQSSNKNSKNIITNYGPEANFKWSLPMIGRYKNSTLVIEPLVTIAVSSYKNDSDEVPNEDTSSTELTQSNLFLSDRFSGFDRNESGKRISYGFKSSSFNDFGQFGLGLGQSWKPVSRTQQDVVIRGFNNNKSNIVGQFTYKAPKIFSMNYNFHLNESNYRNDINELGTVFNFERVILSSNYILIRKNVSNDSAKEQLDLNFMAYLTKKLTFGLQTSRNLVENVSVTRKYSLNYGGCCVVYEFSISEENPTALAKPQKSYNFNLSIKNL